MLAGEFIAPREIDQMVLTEGVEPAPIYELLRITGSTDEDLLMMRDRFHIALAAYRAQNWAEAESGFVSCLQLFPEDGPCCYYMARVTGASSQAPT